MKLVTALGTFKYFGPLGLVLLMAVLLSACDLIGGQPAIDLATDHHDLGAIEPDGAAVDFVTVYNRGEGELVISQVTTTCGCTVGKMVDPVIAPGGEGQLEVTVEPRRVHGDTSTKTLTIFSNDPNTPARELKISATVKPAYEVVPVKLDLGLVRQGGEGETRMRIRQLQQRLLSFMRDPVTAEEYLAAEVVEVAVEDRTDPEKMEYDLVVTVVPDAPLGKHSSRVVLLSNVRNGTITVPVTVNIAPAN